jgi:hypothetical protein
MDSKNFVENFGHIADAPNGGRMLRELILILAFEGKLLPQSEESLGASDVVGKFKKKKQLLVDSNKVTKS